MTRRQLIEWLYNNNPPSYDDIEKLVGTRNIHECKRVKPQINGDYLVHHLVYGWCLYGFTTLHSWGCDDHVTTPAGEYFKVTYWTELTFLEDYNETAARSV